MSRKNFYHNRLSWRADARGIFDYQEPVGLLDLPEALQTKPDVERIRTPYQVIDLIRHTETAPDDEGRPAGVLHINGRFQLQSQTSAAYHEPMVHLPLALATKPVRHVLVLGGGDGALVRELRRHEATIESAVLVDIDAEIVRLARTEPFLKELNDDAFTWPKLRIEIGDAMAYLRGHKEQFDAVFIDLTYPYEFDSARFYSVEFFRLIRRRLNQDGFFVIGSPTDLLAARHTPWQDILYATVHTASYPTQIAINGPRDHFLVAGLGTLHTSPTLDPSLGLKALNPTSLGSWRVEKMTGEPRLQMINSVMQPRSLGIEDGFF